MPHSLARNGLIAIVTFAVLSTCDVKSTEAQGLLRRLQQRIRSRVESPVPNAPAVQPRTSDPSAQRLSPVDPDAGQPDQGASTGSEETSPSLQRGRFGGSILSRPLAGRSNSPESDSKPTMGIQVIPVTDGTPGLRVAGIREGSLAKQAGLRENDLIVAIDGRPTPNIDSIRDAMQGRRPGDRLRATVRRGDATTSVTIPLLDSASLASSSNRAIASAQPAASDPQTQQRDSLAAADQRALKTPIESEPIDLGVEVQTPSGQRGVVLSTIRPNSAAAAAGLSEGDRIVSINGRLILDEPGFRRELSRHAEGETLAINAIRGETLNTYEVRLSNLADQAPGGGTSSASKVASSPDGPATSGGSATQGSGGDRPVLGGLRSVLGGLFGGSSASDSSTKDVALGEGASADGTPRGAGPGNRNAVPGNGNAGPGNDNAGPGNDNAGGQVVQAGGAVDPLALPDDEPIDRVGFEAELTPPSRTLPADPPSVEELTPPPAQPDGELPTADATAGDSETESIEKDKLIESLREEIRRLRQRLNSLESNRSTAKDE